ncbi:unnamed protein product [Orchesella dallaii]|uniref:Peptidase M12B domain-containing protein n=1 Tax=Orchesella dallaii TaxID=48710 RepID=A0ABP1PYB6_9HEXA
MEITSQPTFDREHKISKIVNYQEGLYKSNRSIKAMKFSLFSEAFSKQNETGVLENLSPLGSIINQTSKLAQTAVRKTVKSTEKVPGVSYFVVETQVLLDSVLEDAIKQSAINITAYLGIFFHTINHIYANSYASDESFPTIEFQVSNFATLSKTIEEKIFKSQSYNGDNIVDIEMVLKRIRNYGKRTNGKYDKYDHTILLTGRDLYRKVNDMFEPDVLGVAYLRGACTKSDDEKYESFSVVEDIGGHFLGVYPVVHEFAHNFGVKHDSKKKHCSAAEGFIMSPSTLRTENMFQFSSCSLESMKEFLLSSKSKCLAKTTVKPAIPPNQFKEFPGDHYNMSDLCEYFARINYNEAGRVFVNPSKSPSYLCKQLSCKITISTNKKIVFEPPFAPGENIRCGYYGEGRCINGECVESQREP